MVSELNHPYLKYTLQERQKTPVYFTHANKRLDPKVQADIQQLQDTFKAFNPKIQDLRQHINNADSLTKDRKMLFAALSPIVPIRRISSLEDNINDGNYARAAGLIGLMAINLPEDTRDLKAAAKQIFKSELPKYDYKNCQAPFSFFRGTILEPIVNKLGKLGVWLYSIDNTLYHTRFGKFIRKIFKVKIDESKMKQTGREVPQVTLDKFGKPVIKKFKVFAQAFEGNAVSKLVGRTLIRIPVISVAVLSILEIPSIIKKINSADNTNKKIKEGSKQTLKSFINVASLISSIGLIGALFARKGPAYSLLGMGVGSVVGTYTSKAAQNQIDNFARKN